MKKWLLFFCCLLIAWIWSYQVVSHNLPSFIKINSSAVDNKVENISLPVEILQYDKKVEEGVCLSGNPEFSKGLISFTFDDGWREIYENAIPILNRAGIKSTQYVSTAVLKQDDFLDHYMSIENVLNMERMGHEIASHAVDHGRFIEMTEAEVKFQIEESRKELIRMGVKFVDTLAPPYGEYTDYSVELSRKSQYVGVRNAIPGMNDRKTDRFMLYGYQLENWMVFSPYLKRLVDRANAENKWLILIFHQVAKPDYQFYTSQEDLIRLINYVMEKKIPVMTVRDVIKKCQN